MPDISDRISAAQLIHRLRPVIWAASALAVIVMLAWSAGVWTPRGDGQTVPTPSAPPNTGVPGVDRYPPEARVPAPPLSGKTLDGQMLTLTELKGALVIINVWGSWCAPCRDETPDLVRLANRYAGPNLAVVGINTKDNPAAANAFVRRFRVPYPSINDSDGRGLLGFKGIIPTTAVPTTVIVDRQGRIAARIIGRTTYGVLESILADERQTTGGR